MPATREDPSTTDARKVLLATLDSVEPIVTMSHDDLVVIALGTRAAGAGVDYVTLADDKPGAFEISELDQGSVPTVQIKVGPQPLVVLAGETIVGGKQNRVINVSVWLAPQKVTPIPVTCLEHGRWNAGHMFSAGAPVDLDFRAKVSGMVNEQTRMGRSGFAADQSGVWNEISMKERLAARHSPTGALHDLYATETQDLDSIVSAFPVPEGASGVAVGIGGKLLVVDVFDSPATLRRQWHRLMVSAASALFDHRLRVAQGWLPKSENGYPDSGALDRMLARAKKATANARAKRSVGEGWDVRLATDKLHGSALVNQDRVIHAALFRHEDQPKPPAPQSPRHLDTPDSSTTGERGEQARRSALDQRIERYWRDQPDPVRPDPVVPVPEPALVPVRRRH